MFNVIRFFRIRGTSERIARGFALGMIVNFFPTFGFGVLISGFFARLLGGNAVAGFVGGATLTFAWPLLFYFNIKTGGLFHEPVLAIDDPDDVTPGTMDALMWGAAFTIGACVNALVAGLAVYCLLLLAYERARPLALVYFRHHAREHQQRFGLSRSAKP